jgi:16S rRNA processing protein RimM
VVSVENYGAGDLLEIELPGGKRFLVPMTEAAVPEWNEERVLVSAAFVKP